MNQREAISQLEEIKKRYKINPVSDWGQAINTAIFALEEQEGTGKINAVETMGRLTVKAQSNCGYVWSIKTPYSAQDAVDRLAAYEDTGLEPEEITTEPEENNEMNRLKTDTPNGNFETMLNFAYGKDGWAYIRHDGEHADVRLTDWVKRQCLLSGCDEVFTETPEEIDQRLCDCMMDGPICPIAMAYCFASQAVHLQSRLKMYEDTMPLERAQELAQAEKDGRLVVLPPNDPLTLEELREMDGEPVWVTNSSAKQKRWFCDEWALISVNRKDAESVGTIYHFENYGDYWLAYLRKPEDTHA